MFICIAERTHPRRRRYRRSASVGFVIFVVVLLGEDVDAFGSISDGGGVGPPEVDAVNT